MKTALEFYDEIDLTRSDVIKAMKEYAKQIAEKALQDAAKNAKVIFIDGKTKEQTSHLMLYSGAHCMIPDTDLILNTKIQLP